LTATAATDLPLVNASLGTAVTAPGAFWFMYVMFVTLTLFTVVVL